MGLVGRTDGKGRVVSAAGGSRKAAGKAPAKPIPKRPYFTTTDTGNTERLVHIAGSDFKYVTSWGRHIVWNGALWREDKGGGGMLGITKRCLEDIKGEAKDLANTAEKLKDSDAKDKAIKRSKGLWGWWRASEARPRREAMIKLAHGERGIDIEHSKLDANPWILGVANGVIDLKTGKLLPNKREYLLTKRTATRFDPKARAPKWQAFIKQVIPDQDIRDFVQRFVGYAITGLATERMFLILFGGGRNGKSVFLRTLQDMLGPYAVSTAPGLLMARQNEAHPTEVADLFNIRLAVASEVAKGRVINEEQVKRLTGDDVLKARKMREDFWEFEPTFKLMIAANHKPQVRDDSDSFWDRLALIPFLTRIAEDKIDHGLRGRLKTELSGILAWAVEGCLAWQKIGLKRPKPVVDATKEYRASEDTLGKFFDEICRFGIGFESTTGELATAVKRWCEGNNLVYTFREKDLAEKLAEKGCVRAVIGPKDSRARGWRGLGLVRPDPGSKKMVEPLTAMEKAARAAKKAAEPPLRSGAYQRTPAPEPPVRRNSVPPPAANSTATPKSNVLSIADRAPPKGPLPIRTTGPKVKSKTYEALKNGKTDPRRSTTAKFESSDYEPDPDEPDQEPA